MQVFIAQSTALGNSARTIRKSSFQCKLIQVTTWTRGPAGPRTNNTPLGIDPATGRRSASGWYYSEVDAIFGGLAIPSLYPAAASFLKLGPPVQYDGHRFGFRLLYWRINQKSLAIAAYVINE